MAGRLTSHNIGAAGVTVKALYAALVAYGRQLRHDVDLQLAGFVRRHLGVVSPAPHLVHATAAAGDWPDSQATLVDDTCRDDDGGGDDDDGSGMTPAASL